MKQQLLPHAYQDSHDTSYGLGNSDQFAHFCLLFEQVVGVILFC